MLHVPALSCGFYDTTTCLIYCELFCLSLYYSNMKVLQRINYIIHLNLYWGCLLWHHHVVDILRVVLFIIAYDLIVKVLQRINYKIIPSNLYWGYYNGSMIKQYHRIDVEGITTDQLQNNTCWVYVFIWWHINTNGLRTVLFVDEYDSKKKVLYQIDIKTIPSEYVFFLQWHVHINGWDMRYHIWLILLMNMIRKRRYYIRSISKQYHLNTCFFSIDMCI
jgi:hypothetical protein